MINCAHWHACSGVISLGNLTALSAPWSLKFMPWTCTCSDCNGLVGVWSCPGFYGTTITVTEDCKCSRLF